MSCSIMTTAVSRGIDAISMAIDDTFMEPVLEVTGAAQIPEPQGIGFIFGEQEPGVAVEIQAAHAECGRFDGDGIGSKLNYLAMAASGRATQKLTIGAWGHSDTAVRSYGDREFGSAGVIDLHPYLCPAASGRLRPDPKRSERLTRVEHDPARPRHGRAVDHDVSRQDKTRAAS